MPIKRRIVFNLNTTQIQNKNNEYFIIGNNLEFQILTKIMSDAQLLLQQSHQIILKFFTSKLSPTIYLTNPGPPINHSTRSNYSNRSNHGNQA